MTEHSTTALESLVPTVLLVDDDPLVLSALKRTLRVLQVNVHSEPGGLEALAWIAAGGLPAVVISDNSMPSMTGLELLAEIERRVPTAFLVLHTGDGHLEVNLRSGTMLTILAKPAEPEILRRLVWAALRATTEPASLQAR